MRWKLLRRRLSISAPRVIVRSHLPWPLRWVALAVVFGFSAALAMWAYETGKTIAGVQPDAAATIAGLRAEVQSLKVERDRAQSQANAADGLLKAEHAAQQRLAAEMRQLEERKQRLESDLGFFERLLPAATGQPVQLRALHAEAVAPGQLHYQMLLMQDGKATRDFIGRYNVVLVGTLGGRPWTLSLPGGPQPLKLHRYARVEGRIDHPRGAVLQTVRASITDSGGSLRVSESIRLP